ncbi:MAG: hypothetical protein V3R57_06235 [Candidatus Bathyarchaeia archaeon]
MRYLWLLLIPVMAFGINSANKVIKAINDIELDPGTKVAVKGRLHIEAQDEIRFEDSTGGEYVGIRAPDPVGSSLTFILPSVDGSAGEFLSTDGGGNLTFAPGGFPFVASVDNSIIKADTVGSDEIQESGIIIDDSDQVTGVSRLNIDSQGELRLEDAAGGEYVALKSSTIATASYVLTLPDAQGSIDQVLKNDGSGNLSWEDDNDSGALSVAKYENETGTLVRGDAAISHSADSTCAIQGSAGDLISSVSCSSTGVVAVTLKAATCAALTTMYVQATCGDPGFNCYAARQKASVTSVTIRTIDDTDTLRNRNFDLAVICEK